MILDIERNAATVIRAVSSLKNGLLKLEADLEALGYDVEKMRNADGPIVQLEYGEIGSVKKFMSELEEYRNR